MIWNSDYIKSFTKGEIVEEEGLLSKDLEIKFCKKCGIDQNFTMTQKQKRSADEGMSVEYHCTTCRQIISG